jgi:hypothetical protein
MTDSEEGKYLGRNPFQWHFLHHKYYTGCPSTEPVPLLWLASIQSPKLWHSIFIHVVGNSRHQFLREHCGIPCWSKSITGNFDQIKFTIMKYSEIVYMMWISHHNWMHWRLIMCSAVSVSSEFRSLISCICLCLYRLTLWLTVSSWAYSYCHLMKKKTQSDRVTYPT